jgi:hypothetical protein
MVGWPGQHEYAAQQLKVLKKRRSLVKVALRR